MQERIARAQPSALPPWTREVRVRAAAFVALALACSLLLPAVPMVGGVFLVVAVALHAWSADLRPFVQPLLRVPVAKASVRHGRLLLLAGAGALLVASGAAGASMRGHLRAEREQREGRREAGEKGALDLMERVQGSLAAGDVDGAELALLDAGTLVDADSEWRAEVDELLERVRRSGDRKAILDLLVRLPRAEFESFEQGGSVPQALDFGDRALNRRALGLAFDQLAEARRLRARR
jgi:hypothetical protein